MSKANVYTVNQRIVDLQSRVLALETENKTLRQWVLGELSTKIHDSMRVIQDSIIVPVDGKDGRDGAQGAQGIQGERGPAGRDCTTPTDSELAEAVNVLRLKLAKWQAAVQFAYEQNTGTKHQGLKKAIELTLSTVVNRANS